MLYIKCPTCKTILGNKQIPLEEGLEKICSKHLPKDKADAEKQELLEKLQILNPCCKMRALTYTKLIDIIH